MKPEPRLILALAACGIPAVLGLVYEPVVPALLGLVSLLLVLFVVDLRLAQRGIDIHVERVVPGALALGTWCDVRLHISNNGSRSVDLEVYDHHPAAGDSRGLPREIRVAPDEKGVVPYRFRSRRRGEARFDRVELMALSPLKFWRIRRWSGTPTPVRVYPDFRSVQRYAILAVEDALGPTGVRKRPKRGEGLELHQLRDYRDGDALRQIDWKATSRLARIISRQYEDERNQQLVFMLDCGWRMRARDRGEAHFDRALNTLLLLTYVATRQGDAVGLLTMAGSDRWLPPQRGPLAMKRMLEAVFDLETSLTQPDFVRAASRLMVRQPRRALVVILSNLRDEDSEEVAMAVQLMRRRHLVLFASLREPELDAAADAPITDFEAALRTGATRHYLEARRRAHDRLQGRGVMTLDVLPADLPVALVNRYHAIKRSGSL